MTESTLIELDRLRSNQRNGQGTFQATTVKVVPPDPCTQPNAPGALRGFDSLDHFRKSARNSGSAFRRALNSSDT